MRIPIKRLNDRALLPSIATPLSAGFDLYSDIDYELTFNEAHLFPTGISIALPANTVGMVCPRSGLAANQLITVLNAPGIIDADYTGEIKVLLINHSKYLSYKIKKGDRIAQLVIAPTIRAVFEEVDALPPTNRGDGGFGSTGC
ncbi:MAG: dUTP diphosphatase [Waterburya sp.]